MTAAVYGYTGTRADGTVRTATGSPTETFASIVTYADAAAFQAALNVVPAAPAISLSAYAFAELTKILVAGQTFNVAASGDTALEVLCDGTNATRADLAMFADFGLQFPTGTKTFVDNNGIATVLTGTELVALATLAGTWIDDVYQVLGEIYAGLASNPAAITTTAQIDAAFAAT